MMTQTDIGAHLRLNARCEPLETRRHFVVSVKSAAPTSASLDPNYFFSYAAIEDKVGSAFRVFEAVPTKGDRTFLLADRDEHSRQDTIGTEALLTIIAVDADGKLDPTFGTGGVALTGRVIQYVQRPGRLAVDGLGRVYYADNTRILRLRHNGTTDRDFGVNGAAGLAPAKSVLLCDIVPTDDGGVLVATTFTARNVQHFTVQKVDRTVSTVWTARHDGGLLYDAHSEYNSVDPKDAQFATAGGHVFLAHVETNGHEIPFSGPDSEPGDTTIGITGEDVVLTRFDAAGHGSDLIRRDLDIPGGSASAALGTGDERYPNYDAVAVSKNGRNVLVQTDRELLKFDFHAHTFHRSTLPGTYASSTVNLAPDHRLLADGGIGVIVNNYDKKGRTITELDRYRPDGSHDPSFDDSGVFVVKQQNYAAGNDNIVEQIFLDASGRLNFLSTGTITGGAVPGDLTLRRLS